MHDSDIRDRVDQWFEDAGIHGRCRDGQRGFALDRLITVYPRMELHAHMCVIDERLGVSQGMNEDKPDPKAKRRFYLIAFGVAFGIDYLLSAVRGDGFKPSLIGLAVMITAALFFTYSLIRER